MDNRQIWPRYHQLDVVRQTLADAREKGAGQKYLIQHSAGSGKSNSIAWLSRQLISLTKDNQPVFDSIIVITDRRVLDSQINRTIRQFTQVAATVGHAESSGDLRRFIEEGKKIIISTVQKFPFILDDISKDHQDKSFAIIIDEAHSSQGGKTATAMNTALGGGGDSLEDEDDYEDEVTGSSKAVVCSPTPATSRSPPLPKPDPGTVRTAGHPARRRRAAPAIPQLHHEAGHRRRLHHGRADQLHADPQLLQHHQEDRRGP